MTKAIKYEPAIAPLDFSRGSSGTYFDNLGVLQTAGVDEARLTHDPATLEAEGLLIEEQRTNLNPWLAASTTNWLDNGATSSDLTDGAFGVFDGVLVESGGATFNRLNTPLFSVASATQYAITALLKFGSSGQASIRVRNTTSGMESILNGVEGNLVASGSNAGPISNISQLEVADGWIVKFIFTPDDSGSANVGVGPDSSVVGENVIVYAAMVEQGSFATSLIKTEGSQVTRSADECSRDLGIEFNQDEGTIFIDATQTPRSGAIPYFEFAEDSAAPPNRFRIAIGGDNRLRFQSDAGGVLDNEIVDIVPAMTLGQAFSEKIALSYTSSGDVTISVGTLGVWSPVSGLTTNNNLLDILRISGSNVTTISTALATTRDFKYFPRALSATELQELTA